MSEYVWIISIAHAAGSASRAPRGPPEDATASAAASVSTGRSRLPPANTL